MMIGTESRLEEMGEQLDAMQPALLKAQEETAAMMATITAQQREADKVQQVVLAEDVFCSKQAEEAEDIRRACLHALEAAVPGLERAVEALKALSKSDVLEIKATKKPIEARRTLI